MNLKLKDKVLIVSGGARGIGGAITKTLAQEGAIPVIADRLASDGEVLLEQIKQEGGKGLVVSVDLSDADSCKKVVKKTVEAFGSIDGVVNNAGVNDSIGLEQGSPDAFKISVNQNLLHYYNLVHYALPYLKKSKGAIVNISSKTAITGQGGTSGYAASKGAQLALTREWAVELAPYGIRVNAIVPSEVKTPLYEQWISSFENAQEKMHQIVSKVPFEKRMTKPEEVADMAVFLLSEKSSHTTGQWFFVDGGYVHLDRSIS